MGCSPVEIMDLEVIYLDALARVSDFELEDALVLTGEGVRFEFRRLPPIPIADITDEVWVLEDLIRGDEVSKVRGERATLELFSDGSVLGSTGCRSLNGRYEVERAQVLFTEFSAVGDCEPDLETQDGHAVTVLGDGFRAVVDDRTLTITSAGNLGLIYRAES
jgi:heat shock protein HslJ